MKRKITREMGLRMHEARGLPYTCGMCEKYWEDEDSLGCTETGNCGSSCYFFKYSGPLSDLRTVCFQCGDESTYILSDKVGACKDEWCLRVAESVFKNFSILLREESCNHEFIPIFTSFRCKKCGSEAWPGYTISQQINSMNALGDYLSSKGCVLMSGQKGDYDMLYARRASSTDAISEWIDTMFLDELIEN